MKTEFKHKGFTLIELLATMAIIILLAGILVPAFNKVRLFARNTSQKAQLTTIDMAVMTFKNDHGSYPPSSQLDPIGTQYNGAQTLAEALLGWDLLGFHPQSAWMENGMDATNNFLVYDRTILANLNARKGPYIEPAKANAFTIAQLFGAPGPFTNRYVLCDSFGVKRVTVGTGPTAKVIKAGAPILYYKANTVYKTMGGSNTALRIYNVFDNMDILALGKIGSSPLISHPLANPIPGTLYKAFNDFVINTQIPSAAPGWPYRADSYILISAGADGLYGTDDDITNFGN